MDFVNIFITFGGRINRAKYWIAVVIYTAVSFVFGTLAAVGGGGSAVRSVNAVIGLMVAVSGIGVAIKRLHDRNRSGWYVLLFVVAPAVLLGAGFMIGTVSKGTDLVSTVLWLVAIVIGVWGFVELGCLRGTIGQNQYGPDPLAPEVLTPPVRTHA